MHSGKIEIQKALLADALQLQEISRSTFYDTYAEFNTKENVKQYLEVHFALEQLQSELKDINCEFYFAKLNSEIIGYIKVNFEKAQTVQGHPNSLEIERIYVKKEIQGKKTGFHLLQKAIEISKQHQHNYLWLGVWENNTKAIDFYKKQNFELFGTHPFKFGEDMQTDYLMKINLL